MKRLALASVCLAAGAALLLPALAHPAPPIAVQGSATATLTVHAHVVRNCIITASPIDFGDYDPLVANRTQPLDTQGWLQFSCTKNTGVKVELDDGQNASGGQRRMASTGSTLEYEIYQDAGHTQRFGSGAEASDHSAALVSTRAAWAIFTYGRVPGGQNVAPGDYDDTITATIIF